MRILITGSRDLEGDFIVSKALTQAHRDLVPLTSYRVQNKPTLIVGRCPTGADAKAEFYADLWGWTIEPYEPDWAALCRPTCKPNHRRTRASGDDYCPAQGNYRNQDMVDAGADLCLAFYKQGAANIGTSDCVRRAKKAGIPVREYYE